MHMTRSASVAENDLVLRVTGAPASTPGRFYYGSVMTQTPFGNGFRCISGSVTRLPVAFTHSAGTTAHAFDSSAQLPQVNTGTSWHFQFWYRDSQGGGEQFNLSDALTIDYRP